MPPSKLRRFSGRGGDTFLRNGDSVGIADQLAFGRGERRAPFSFDLVENLPNRVLVACHRLCSFVGRLAVVLARSFRRVLGEGACFERAAIASCDLRSAKPSTSRRISSVCSPNSGERSTSVGQSDSLIGMPTFRYLPRSGWSTSTTVPVSRSDGSSAISFIDRIGPHGMSSLFRMSIASNLVLVLVHSSISPKISIRCGSRAFGVAKRGSVEPLRAGRSRCRCPSTPAPA